MKLIQRLLLLIIAASIAGCTGLPEGIKPVEGFKLNRYLGKWYEIARYDHSFERGMNQVTAKYTMREDGGVNVLNQGFDTLDGEWESAHGKAYFVGEPNIGHLKVSFFGPFYGSYVIMDLDEEYQVSVVTSYDRSYLWLLSRTPKIESDDLRSIVNKLEQHNFDTSKLIWVEQSSNSKT